MGLETEGLISGGTCKRNMYKKKTFQKQHLALFSTVTKQTGAYIWGGGGGGGGVA